MKFGRNSTTEKSDFFVPCPESNNEAGLRLLLSDTRFGHGSLPCCLFIVRHPELVKVLFIKSQGSSPPPQAVGLHLD
jgi:hypothetical protein